MLSLSLSSPFWVDSRRWLEFFLPSSNVLLHNLKLFSPKALTAFAEVDDDVGVVLRFANPHSRSVLRDDHADAADEGFVSTVIDTNDTNSLTIFYRHDFSESSTPRRARNRLHVSHELSIDIHRNTRYRPRPKNSRYPKSLNTCSCCRTLSATCLFMG